MTKVADLRRTSQPVLGSAALDALAEALGPRVQREAPLAPFTAIHVGGPADLLIVAESVDELARAVGAARRHGVPFHVLGGGCNVLVADEGVRGLVIINRAASISFEDCLVRAASGARLARLARETIDSSLAGMAWAAGLPGTVGGAVVGNAGAFDGDIADTLCSGTVLEPDGEIVERENVWFDFTYRGSRLKSAVGPTWVVLAATFELKPGDKETLQAQAEEALGWRKTHHPTGSTMGSTFKNPSGHYAGRLIEQAGLKGYRVGGARISEQHANFIINDGEATASDVLALIEHSQAEVERQLAVRLALEIELLGW